MSTPHAAGLQAGVATPARAVDFYRAVWRWHFYAGLLALPFMLVLAITGGIYLFHGELDRVIYRDLLAVPASSAPAQAPSTLVRAATGAVPGTPFRYVPPASETSSAQVGVRTAAGAREVVYLDPRAGTVLGTLPDKGGIVWIIRQIHSLAWFGPVANALIEIAAGWAILLILTGVYLWWPRGQRGGVMSVRGAPRQRVFWRDLHAVVGVVSAGFILFLALTGMPWSLIWGAKVNQWANGNNFGYPDGVRVNVPMSDARLAESAKLPWSMAQMRVPMSAMPAGDRPGQGHDAHGVHGSSAMGNDEHAGHGAASTPVAPADDEHAGHGGGARAVQPPPVVPNARPIGLDAAVAAFDKLGLAPGYTISLPSSPTGVYSASAYPVDLEKQRVVHLDQYRGVPLLDMSYADYGPAGKGLEWGINVHMGQEFGLANQLLMLAACIAIVMLCVSAAVMWWKRRPSGRFGVPPMPADPRTLRTVVALLAIGGVIFPLVGLSMLAMLALDVAWIKTRRAAT